MATLIKKLHALVTSKRTIQQIIIILLSMFFISLDNSFGFNPFIIATLYCSYILSPSSFLVTIAIYLIFSTSINIYYGIEIAFIIIFFIFILEMGKFLHISNNIKNKLSLTIFSISVGAFYFLLNITINNIIPSFLLTLVSIVFSLECEKLISFFNEEEILNAFDLSLIIGILSSLFFKLGKMNIFLFLILFIAISSLKKENSLSTILISFLCNYLISEFSLKELFYIYFPLILILFFNKKKYAIPFFYVLFSSFYLEKFYTNLLFYAFLSAYFIYLMIPNKIFEKLKRNINSIENNDLFKANERIIKTMDLLSYQEEYLSLINDKRFFRKHNLEKKCKSLIINEVCIVCSKKKNCFIYKEMEDYIEGIKSFELVKANCILENRLQRKMNEIRAFYKEEKEIIMLLEEKKNAFRHEISLIKETTKIIKENLKLKPKIDRVIKNFDYQVVYKTKSEGKYNGDSFYTFSNQNNGYCILSDGMGHNKSSNKVSSYSISLFNALFPFFESIKDIILEINTIQKSQMEEELYSTFDLLSLHLDTGTFSFYKLGSFASYIYQDGILKKINNNYPPLGILLDVNIYPFSGVLKDDDLFIMLSDGFNDECEAIILDSLNKSSSLPLEEIKNMMFDDLCASSSLKDDKSLAIIKIRKI